MLALLLLALGLGIEVVGYHYLGDLEWLDALLNASRHAPWPTRYVTHPLDEPTM